MSENVTTLPGAEATQPKQVQADVVRGLESLLEQARNGDIHCLIGVGMNPQGGTFEYSMGHPGSGIALIGQLDMAAQVLRMRALQSRRQYYQF